MKVFFAISQREESSDIIQIVKDIIENYKHEIIMEIKGQFLSIDYNNNINNYDLIIADISDYNRNVVYQLGYAAALKKT